MRGRIFVRDERVLWRHIVDGVLLSTPDSEEILTIRGAGAELWDLLAEPHTAAAIAQAMSPRFDRSADEILAEIEPVLGDLAARRVVLRIITADPGGPL